MKPQHPPRPMAAPRRVAVLVDTSTSWGRSLIQGVHQFARRRSWQLFLEPLGLEQEVHLPRQWKGDGVIARIGYPAMAAELRKLEIPVINVSRIVLRGVHFPRVTVDVRAWARMAAEYFLARGFRRFAYFGLQKLPYVTAHQRAFAQTLRQHGCACTGFVAAPWHGAEPDWTLDADEVGAWLRGLPKPVAVLTWNASCARDVLYACQAAGFRVPEEVAILSGSEDELFCALAPVPLSGIQTPAEQVGARAAELLEGLMNGQPAPAPLTEFAPQRIITRQSTDTFAVSDPALIKALHFIRDHAACPIQVKDVARAAAISRRVLERRFAQSLKRTPADEIRRVHLESAMRLLHETNLTMPEVARAAGFGSPEYFATVFRRELGATPLEFRKGLKTPGAQA